MIPSNFHPTQRQLDVLESFTNFAHEAYVSLMTQARAAQEAVEQLGLGTLGADGDTVRQGANRAMYGIKDACLGAAECLKLSLDRDFVDYTRYRLRYVGGRFITEQHFDTEYAHLKPILADLEAKFGNG